MNIDDVIAQSYDATRAPTITRDMINATIDAYNIVANATTFREFHETIVDTYARIINAYAFQHDAYDVDVCAIMNAQHDSLYARDESYRQMHDAYERATTRMYTLLGQR